MQIHVKGGKGKKDRLTVLSLKTLLYLEQYRELYQPKQYWFESPEGGAYSERSA
jgi:integrase